MLKIHYHSDCPFFAGCENMLANFFNSEDFRKTHNVSFSHRQSVCYTQGFKQRVKRELPVFLVLFPDLFDLSKLPTGLPLLCKRLIMVFLRLMFNGPLLLYEIVVLFHLFKKNSPDILHINNGGYPAALSARAAAIAGKLAGIQKVLMVVNNMAFDYQHYSRWLDYPVDRLVVRSVDLFLTGSEAAASRLRYVLSLPTHKVVAIHNGISLRKPVSGDVATRERLGLGKYGGVVFGVVALLIPRKGHKVLLEAVLKLVQDSRVDANTCKILIEGDGPLRKSLVDFVCNHNLEHLVTFVGDEQNIVDFMGALDVLILPSISEEDFPNVILEAMALGKPVIASRLAGTPEQVVDDVTGLLVDPCDISQLADAICHLVASQEVRSEMGRAALERFTCHFTSEIAIRNYSKMYQKIYEA